MRYPDYKDPEKGFVEKCYRNILYNGKFYPDGLSLPKSTSFNGIEGKFKIYFGTSIGEYAESLPSNNWISIRTNLYGFLWKFPLREDTSLEILSFGGESTKYSLEWREEGRFCILSHFPTYGHIYEAVIYLKTKGKINEELNYLYSMFNCGERIDECIYKRLHINDVYSCLERGKERISEDGSLFPFFTTSSWCDENVECPYDEFKRTFFSPPFSCPPGYPFSEE